MNTKDMTTTLRKYNAKGKQDGTITVSEEVFGTQPNVHVLHLALRRELANGRAGTANTKTRSDVSGGGRKPWKQKGTGRARAGSTRSPLWVGGGVIFGPKPRDFSFSLPKKVRVVAMRSMLSTSHGKFHVIPDFSFLTAPKTKVMAGLVKSLGLEGKKILILADYKAPENQYLHLSARNLESVKISLPHNLSVKDMLSADAVIVTEAAVREMDARYGGSSET